MATVRPLRELLTDLVGDADARAGGPESYLAEHGHADLPPELVAEAVVSFADTAPPEVALHLAPFVTAHTAGHEDTADWFDLLTSAPTEPADDLDTLADDVSEPWSDDFGPSLDFGAGAADVLDFPPATVDEVETAATPTDWPAADEQSPAEIAAPDTSLPATAEGDELEEEPLD